MPVLYISRLLAILLLTGSPLLMAQQKQAVKTIIPSPAAAGRNLEIPGRTEPLESATLFSRATGVIRERKFDIGDVVKSGDVMAIVDVPELDRTVIAAQASIDQAKARAKNARSLAERSSNLLASQAISREESEQRIASAEELDAAVRVAEADYQRLLELQKFATITAPFDAVVYSRNLDRGDRVNGDASSADGWLYRIARVDSLRFVVNATPDLALRLEQDATASIRFNEMPGKKFPAKVNRSSKVFEAASGTMRVELLLENKDLSLPVGLTGIAAFTLAPSKETFVVPNNTLVVRDGKNALLVESEGKVAVLEILPGRNLGATVEVTSAALKPDTRIIINPNAMVRPGDAVDSSPVEIKK